MVAPSLRARIAHWTAQGYRVISETPTSAELVRPKRFSVAEFVATPLYVLEYLGQREQQVYLAVTDTGEISESGSGIQVSAYRRAQGMTATARLSWVVIGLVVIVVAVLIVQALT